MQNLITFKEILVELDTENVTCHYDDLKDILNSLSHEQARNLLGIFESVCERIHAEGDAYSDGYDDGYNAGVYDGREGG